MVLSFNHEVPRHEGSSVGLGSCSYLQALRDNVYRDMLPHHYKQALMSSHQDQPKRVFTGVVNDGMACTTEPDIPEIGTRSESMKSALTQLQS